MSAPRIQAVLDGSAAQRAGLQVGDEVTAIDGEQPRDIIRWTWLTDEGDPLLDVRRGGLDISVQVDKAAGEPLGIEVQTALFDQLRTCDNHCEFCFIYQLPPGLRKSLYLKDDDYRLSFLYGNFTTLTRFTEADLERVITENLSPLNVSIHAVDASARNALLRNRRGGPSLRWLRALLDHGIEIHGQIVCCPGINDGPVLDETLAGVLDQFPDLASLCVVPLGISQFNGEPAMRATTTAEAAAVVECVESWQEVFLAVLGSRMVFASDEYYLLADRPFPPADSYEGFSMHEDGVGMARTFELEFLGQTSAVTSPVSGFFAWSDGAEARSSMGGRYEAAGDYGAPAEGYRAVRTDDTAERASAPVQVALRPRPGAPTAVLTSAAGAAVLIPLIDSLDLPNTRVLTVDNHFFGGTTSVTGLLVGEDLSRVLSAQPQGHRYLLPDVCLSGGRFLDGTTPADLPRPVEIVPTDGAALRRALEA